MGVLQHEATFGNLPMPRVFGIRDLTPAVDQIGRSFSDYVNQAFEVESIQINIDGHGCTDTTLFGSLMATLLKSFISGKSINGDEIGQLRSVHITGMRSMRPVADIKLHEPVQEKTLAPILVKRSPPGRMRSRIEKLKSPRAKKPKIAQSKKEVASLHMSDIRDQLELIQTAEGFVVYTPDHQVQIPTKNLQLRLQYGTNCVTIPALIRLLSAQPWRALIEDALPYRIIRFYEPCTNPQLQQFINLVSEGMSEYAMARWEKQFWIELPSNPEETYSDPIDRAFIERYKQARIVRKSRLFAFVSKISSKLDQLITMKILPTAARRDLGLVQDPRHHVPWLPTQTNLLYGMANRAGRDPCRFYFVLNRYAHSFYEHEYHLAFPPLGNTPPSFEMPTPIDISLFGEELIKKYFDGIAFEEVASDAAAEWRFYRDQLITRIPEPVITRRYSGDDVLAEAAAFEHCRCAYIDSTTRRIIQDPIHPESRAAYRINDSAIPEGLWQDQPIEMSPLEEYLQLPDYMDPIFSPIISPSILESPFHKALV
jgi:hypothetical protein